MIEMYRQLAEQRRQELQRAAAEYMMAEETLAGRCWTWLRSLALARSRNAAARRDFDLAG